MEAAAAAPVSQQVCAKSWSWLWGETSSSSHCCKRLRGAPGQQLVQLRDPRVMLISAVPFAAGWLRALLPPVATPGPHGTRLRPGHWSMSCSARAPTWQPGWGVRCTPSTS